MSPVVRKIWLDLRKSNVEGWKHFIEKIYTYPIKGHVLQNMERYARYRIKAAEAKEKGEISAMRSWNASAAAIVRNYF